MAAVRLTLEGEAKVFLTATLAAASAEYSAIASAELAPAATSSATPAGETKDHCTVSSCLPAFPTTAAPLESLRPSQDPMLRGEEIAAAGRMLGRLDGESTSAKDRRSAQGEEEGEGEEEGVVQ